MVTVFILGILGGADNFQISSAIALRDALPKNRWLLIAPFVFFDSAMSLIGLAIGNHINGLFQNIAHLLGPVVLLIIGLNMLISDVLGKERKDFLNKRWFSPILPFLMSLDNLYTGFALGTTGYPVFSTFIIMAVCSGIMCFAGMLTGEKIRNLLPRKLDFISSIYIILLALFLAIK